MTTPAMSWLRRIRTRDRLLHEADLLEDRARRLERQNVAEKKRLAYLSRPNDRSWVRRCGGARWKKPDPLDPAPSGCGWEGSIHAYRSGRDGEECTVCGRPFAPWGRMRRAARSKREEAGRL